MVGGVEVIHTSFLVLLVICLIIAGSLLLAFFVWAEKVILKGKTVEQLDSLSGLTFEKYLSVLFQELGYSVTVTPDRADFGADLLVKKDGVTTAVQAKRYSKPVGIGAVQEVLGARFHYHTQKAMVVTTNTFTPAAWKLAMSSGVWLIDRRRLEELIYKAKTKITPKHT